MASPWISRVLWLFPDAPSLKQHDRDIDAAIAGGLHSGSQPIEVGLIKLRQINFRLAVERHTRASSQIRQGFDFNLLCCPIPSRLLPDPKAVSYTHLRAHETGRNLV